MTQAPQAPGEMTEQVQDIVSDWLYSLSEAQAVGLRGLHARALRDAIVKWLSTRSWQKRTKPSRISGVTKPLRLWKWSRLSANFPGQNT